MSKQEFQGRAELAQVLRSFRSVIGLECQDKKIEMNRLTGDASTRRYYRARLGQKRYICCVDPKWNKKDYLYQEIYDFLNKNKIPIPQIHGLDKKNKIIVLDDLGDQSLLISLSKIKNRKNEYDLYKKVLDVLIDMHNLTPKILHEKFSQYAFDWEKLNYEVNFTERNFYQKVLKKQFNHSEKKTLNKMWALIIEELTHYPFVFTHRDFHSRNIIIKDKRPYIIDFQDARMGLPQYDLVSLLEDCYYEVIDSNKVKLIDYYWDKFARKLAHQKSKKNFLRIYDLMTIQRQFKAVGSFAYIYQSRKDLRYVRYIAHSMEKIKLILLKYPEYQELRNLLFEPYYEY